MHADMCWCVAAWIVGFLSVLREIGSTAGVTYTTGEPSQAAEVPLVHPNLYPLPQPFTPYPTPTAAILISQYVLLGSGGATNGGTPLAQWQIVCIYIGMEVGCAHACVRACVCVSVCLCLSACIFMHVCARAHVLVHVPCHAMPCRPCRACT